MLGASSVQMAPDRSRPIVWMIKRMIKAHPTQHRMRPLYLCGGSAFAVTRPW